MKLHYTFADDLGRRVRCCLPGPVRKFGRMSARGSSEAAGVIGSSSISASHSRVDRETSTSARIRERTGSLIALSKMCQAARHALPS